MVRYLIVGVFITAALIGAQLYRSQTGGTTQEITQKVTQEAAQAARPTSAETLNMAPIAVEQAVESSNTITAIPQPIDGPDSAENEAGFQPSDLPLSPWQTDESSPEIPVRYVNRGIDVRALKIDKQQLADLSMGDTVKLSIPQNGQDYELSIKEVRRHVNGDKSLKGYLINNPGYTVVMTEGRTSTFATINTPDGSFLLEASGDQGWIMAHAELENLIDPNLVDYKIPDIQRQEQ